MALLDRIVFLQLSDVHIGRKLMNDPDDFETGLKSGYNPHDHRLLLPLENAIKDACRTLSAGQHVNVLISGDLTAAGTDNDYAASFALVHNKWLWKRVPKRTIGFGWPPERTFSVPGNHDHWRKEKWPPPAFSFEIAPAWFENTPWMRPLVGGGSRLVLELYGVDSNSGLRGRTFNMNPFAEGAISLDELSELERKLQNSIGQDLSKGQILIRAIVCHHAFSGKGGLFAAKPLDDGSRNELVRLALKYNVSVILTGHVHTFHEEDWPKGDKVTRKVKELRCATSLQGPARAGVQGFWAHSITLSETDSTLDCRWSASKYQWGGGFFDLDSAGTVNIVPPRA